MNGDGEEENMSQMKQVSMTNTQYLEDQMKSLRPLNATNRSSLSSSQHKVTQSMQESEKSHRD